MKRIYLFLSVFCLAATMAQAGSSNGKSMASNSSSDADEVETKWCGYVASGIAFSMNGNVKNPSTAQFNAGATTGTSVPAAEGSTTNLDNETLGRSSFVLVGVNRKLWDWVSLGVSFESYTPFRYAKQHSGGTLATGIPNSEILSVNFMRSFDVAHDSVMFNFQFGLPNDWAMGVGCTNVSPTFGAGVGVGLNEVRNFQALGFNTVSTSGSALATVALDSAMVTTVGLPNATASVAWQANFGLKFQPEDSNVSFAVAYRFYDGGKFTSASSFMLNDGVVNTNSYTGGTGSAVATATHQGNLVALSAWTGRIRTNQVLLCLDFAF